MLRPGLAEDLEHSQVDGFSGTLQVVAMVAFCSAYLAKPPKRDWPDQRKRGIGGIVHVQYQYAQDTYQTLDKHLIPCCRPSCKVLFF